MILGNPYTFSIIAQTLDEWNINDAFRNGILIFCVDGHIYPEEIVNATLNCEIPFLRRALKNLTTDTSLYNKPKEIAFSEMYDITFPEEGDNDYRFDITPEAFSDKNYLVFAVGNGINIRVLASKLRYIKQESKHELTDINISEAFISLDELKRLITRLDTWEKDLK